MPTYPIHTIASAPENSRPALEQLQQAFGVLPNLAAVISNSPKLVTALVGVFQQVHSSSLTEPEIQIVLLTDAVANEVVTKLRSRDREGGTQVLSRTFSTFESVVPSPCSIRRAEGLPPDWLRRARL
jgi:hypothetical protein